MTTNALNNSQYHTEHVLELKAHVARCKRYLNENKDCGVAGMLRHYRFLLSAYEQDLRDAEWIDAGTQVIISGGEVLELGDQIGNDEIPF